MSVFRFSTVYMPDPPEDVDAIRRRDSEPGAPREGRRSYVGPLVAVAWMAFVLSSYLNSTTDWRTRILILAGGLVYAVGVIAATPIAWRLPRNHRVWVPVGLFALSFVLWPVLHWELAETWVFVGIVIGLSMFSLRTTYLLTGILVAIALVFAFANGEQTKGAIWVPAIIASVTMMVNGFARQHATIRALHATRLELAALEVQKERGRVARDMHDILGHSLTAIAVKAELAGMLIDADAAPQARAEVAALEDLARGALVDVRATVAGYRGVTVVGELANARAVLSGSGIDAELPTSTDDLPADDRELAGWVVREGVTNLLRHSSATRCRVTIGADIVEIADNGRGPLREGDSGSDGNGLRGLAERAAASGWRLVTGRSDLGGFRLAIVRQSGRPA